MPVCICMAWLLIKNRTALSDGAVQRCVSRQGCYCDTGLMLGVFQTAFWKLEGFLGMRHEVVTEFGLLQGLTLAQAVSRRPLTAEAVSYPRPVSVRFLVNREALG